MMISGHTANNPNAAVPWAALSKSPDDFFEPMYLPEGVELEEVSKMKAGALNGCVRHWLKRAKQGDIAFQFKAVQDSHRREGKRKGKGKGKAKKSAGSDEDEEEDDGKHSHRQDPKGKRKRSETLTDDEDEDDQDDQEEEESGDEDEEEEEDGDEDEEGEKQEQEDEDEDEEEEEEEEEKEDSADLVEQTLRAPASEEDGEGDVTQDGPPGEGDDTPPPMWYDSIIPDLVYNILMLPSSSPADVPKTLPDQLAFLLSLSKEPDYLELIKIAQAVPVS
jgi:hypothetical protein